MDDLLIVRRSERVKARFARRPSNAAMGMNFGVVLGAALGLLLASAFAYSVVHGIILGTAFGFAIGGPFGRLFKSPARSYKRLKRDYSYDGLPAEAEETDPEENDTPSPANKSQ